LIGPGTIMFKLNSLTTKKQVATTQSRQQPTLATPSL